MSGPRKPGPVGPGPSVPGSLVARPGYEVGYAKPPDASKFRKGVSGNPRGRPKGTKNKLPALSEERMKAIILEEAYRTITVRDGTKNVTVPIARAVLRSLAVNAVKGQHRSQRLFSELLASVETARLTFYNEWMETVIGYKRRWDEELTRRRVLGITHLPHPIPHPDGIKIDLKRGGARFTGPLTKEDKIEREGWIAQKPELEIVLIDLEHKLATEDDPELLSIYEKDRTITQKLVDILTRMEAKEI
jgi:Family of unknown function (DUF5681)